LTYQTIFSVRGDENHAISSSKLAVYMAKLLRPYPFDPVHELALKTEQIAAM
jgi:hypothetical protein